MSNAPPDFGGPVAWRPTPAVIRSSRLQAFLDRHGEPDYQSLLARSTREPAWFWGAVLDELGIEFSTPYSRVMDTSPGVPWTRWCVDGRMNIVHNCLDKWAGTPVDASVAIRWEGEEGATRTVTFRDLRDEVARFAGALRQLGVGPGDRVAIFMPMCPEIVVAFLAVIRLGAIVLPLFSGYGADAVAGRLRDSGATVLVTADGFQRRGQIVHLKPTADAAVAQAPTVAQVVVVSRLGLDTPWQAGRDHRWAHLMSTAPWCPTVDTGADDPMMLIYTSGTTGRPKGAVHTHCGFPIKTAQDMVHGFDVHQGDTLYWVTDMGWMMGPWEVFGTLLLGATMVLYDGALDHPGPDRLWDLVSRHGVTILGISPTLVRALMAHGTAPVLAHNRASLRVLGSTGEPWTPEAWQWLFRTVGDGRLPIINYSGGTEVSGGLLVGNVLSPIRPCAFAGPPPGIDADVVDDEGQPVRGQVGELVVRQPWIGMTRGFWQDPARYIDTYWTRFPGLWVHGDWAAIDADGQWFVLGRSDDTIKVAGKRLGPSEVEAVLAEDPAILEAAAIGIPDPLKGQALVCVCVLVPGASASADLARRLQDRVAERLGKPLRPSRVLFVPDLPKTRNAKIMRRVIRAAYLGTPPGDVSALENPDTVGAIADAARRALP